MVKKITTYLTEKNFIVSKNTATGNINGFDVHVRFNMYQRFPYVIDILGYQDEETKNLLVNELNDKKIKYCSFDQTLFGIQFMLSGVTVKAIIEKMDELLNTVTNRMNELSFKNSSFCPACGEEYGEDQKLVSIGDFTVKIHSTCYDHINALLEEEEKNFKEAPNNYLAGFAGAFLGGIVGAILMVILFFFGYVASICAIVSFALGTALYKRFGGKQNAMMVVIVAITSICILLLAYVGIYILAADGICAEQKVMLTGVNALKHCLKQNDFEKEFFGNLAMEGLFAFIGLGYSVYAALKSTKRVKHI